jgi:hypothetical protein
MMNDQTKHDVEIRLAAIVSATNKAYVWLNEIKHEVKEIREILENITEE